MTTTEEGTKRRFRVVLTDCIVSEGYVLAKDEESAQEAAYEGDWDLYPVQLDGRYEAEVFDE